MLMCVDKKSGARRRARLLVRSTTTPHWTYRIRDECRTTHHVSPPLAVATRSQRDLPNLTLNLRVSIDNTPFRKLRRRPVLKVL